MPKVGWYEDYISVNRSGGRKEGTNVWKAEVELPEHLEDLGELELMVWPSTDGESQVWCWEIEYRETGASVRGEISTREGAETAKRLCEAALPDFIKDIEEYNA